VIAGKLRIAKDVGRTGKAGEGSEGDDPELDPISRHEIRPGSGGAGFRPKPRGVSAKRIDDLQELLLDLELSSF
jgi:hypothetical protein